MKEITKRIKIKNEANIYKKMFVGNEVVEGVQTNYHCCNCTNKNSIKIMPYDTGRYFGELVSNNVLSKETILTHKIATQSVRNKHLGELLVNDLPTLYFTTVCDVCEENYLVVFGIGEKQPSIWLCEVSGVWAYETN